jgi:hypothetical protein
MTRDNVIFSVRLASGDFSSELIIPLPTTKAEQESAVERWLDMMATSFRIGVERMDATYSPTDQPGERP